MDLNFFLEIFQLIINLLMIYFNMNLYPFIHIYTPIQEFGIVFYFGNVFRIYWQIYLQFVIQLSYLQQKSKAFTPTISHSVSVLMFASTHCL